MSGYLTALVARARGDAPFASIAPRRVGAFESRPEPMGPVHDDTHEQRDAEPASNLDARPEQRAALLVDEHRTVQERMPQEPMPQEPPAQRELAWPEAWQPFERRSRHVVIPTTPNAARSPMVATTSPGPLGTQRDGEQPTVGMAATPAAVRPVQAEPPARVPNGPAAAADATTEAAPHTSIVSSPTAARPQVAPRDIRARSDVRPRDEMRAPSVTPLATADREIVVTIGRIDVRAVQGPVPKPTPRDRQPTMSLDEYLRQRAQGVR